jgi:hypothetical protein
VEARVPKALGEEPPVQPGEGPFHIKATGYLGHMRWVEASYPGGSQAYLEELSPGVRAFFQQQFFAMSFIDIFPIVCAGGTCARAFRMTPYDFVAFRSRNQAEQDLNGVYRAFLRLGNPRLLAVRVPSIFGQYFDFAQPKLLDSDSYHARFEFAGVPWLLADWVQAAYEGFSSVVLKAAGATAPNIEAERVPAGTTKGYPSCRLVITNQWS